MPGEGFEPPTFGLQNRCTTAVLTRQIKLLSAPERAAYTWRGAGGLYFPMPHITGTAWSCATDALNADCGENRVG